MKCDDVENIISLVVLFCSWSHFETPFKKKYKKKKNKKIVKKNTSLEVKR